MTFHSIKVAFWVGISTVSGIVAETCTSICKNIGGDMLRLTNQAVEGRKIEEGFNKRWNMLNCIGAIDWKHIDIQAVPDSGSYYFNYKVATVSF